MIGQWKFAALGALGGAAIAVAVVYGAAVTGNFPGAGDTYIHGYLLAHPEILADMSDKLQAQQEASDEAGRQGAVDKLGQASFFNPKIAFVTGPANAKYTFVEFFDYNCPFCRASLPAVQDFYAKHKADGRFSFIEFPIKGPQSIAAARAAIAAREQRDKYLPFHFAMMKETQLVDEDVIFAVARKVGLDVDKLKADMNAPATIEAVNAALALAHKAGIDGTPAFIVNGHVREGAVNEDILKKLSKG